MKSGTIPYTIIFYIIYLLIILISCKDDDEIIPTPKPSGSNDTTHYDTPFADVPNTSDIIMYEINERAFSASGDFAGIVERLDSIRALGVNMIWLMPIYTIGEINSVNSPYCVKD